MTTWIISDLHLCAQRPAVTQAFLHWLHTEVTTADALYILGDFVEVWVGDDILSDPQHGAEFVPIVQALRALSERDVQLYLMHGNRDFLIGEHFARACGLQTARIERPLELGARNPKDVSPCAANQLHARDLLDLAQQLGC